METIKLQKYILTIECFAICFSQPSSIFSGRLIQKRFMSKRDQLLYAWCGYYASLSFLHIFYPFSCSPFFLSYNGRISNRYVTIYVSQARLKWNGNSLYLIMNPFHIHLVSFKKKKKKNILSLWVKSKRDDCQTILPPIFEGGMIGLYYPYIIFSHYPKMQISIFTISSMNITKTERTNEFDLMGHQFLKIRWRI